MFLKPKYDKSNNVAIITVNKNQLKSISSFIERFGYTYRTIDAGDKVQFCVNVENKDDYKKFKSLWNSAKQFI